MAAPKETLKVLPLLSIILASWILGISGESKHVSALLNARWSWTPLQLEASEFLAQESNEKFWKFVELSKNIHTKSSDLEIYQSVVQNAEQLLTPVGLQLLKFSLSIRSYSPKVELYNKVAHEVPDISDCSSFVQIGSKVTCKLQEAVKLLESANEGSSVQLYDFDHHYPESNENPVTVVLYGQIGTADFDSFHKQLSRMANRGKVHYVLRHYVKTPRNAKVRLSGYGVELAVKKTEYKAVDDTKVKEDGSGTLGKEKEGDDEVEGFLFTKLRKLYPHLNEQFDQFRAHLKESSREMAPLKVWQLQDLSFQAAQRVVSSDPKSALTVLRDLSQNVPKLARSLVRTKVKKDLRQEVLNNQKTFNKIGIEAGESALFINGRLIDIEDMNPFEVLDLLREEGRVLDKLSTLGISGHAMSQLATLSVSDDLDSYALDTRDDSVVFLNDLENDREYSGWPSHIQELLRPTFPGMMRYIAKNIFHVIFFVDSVNSVSVELLKSAEEFLLASMPVRIGIVMVADGKPETDARKSNAAIAIARAFYFLKNEKDPRQAIQWIIKAYNKAPLQDDEALAKAVHDMLVSIVGTDDANEVLGPDSEYDEGRKEWKRFFDRTGLQKVPQVVVNGVPIKDEDLTIVEDSVIRQVLIQTGPLQQAVFMGQLQQYSNIYDHVMSKPNVVKRMNHVIQSHDLSVVDLTGSKQTSIINLNDYDSFHKLDRAQMVSGVATNMNYFTKKHDEMSLKSITNWVVMDMASAHGRKLLQGALQQVKSSSNARIGILHNPSVKLGAEPVKLYLARAVQAVLQSKDHVIPAMLDFLERLLDSENDFEKLDSNLKAILQFIKDSKDLKHSKIEGILKDEKSSIGMIQSHQRFCNSVLGLKPGEAAVIANGRVLGPLKESQVFIKEDFQLLEDFDMKLYGQQVKDIVDNLVFKDLSPDEDTSEYRNTAIMKISSVLSARQKKSRIEIPVSEAEHSAVHIKSDAEASMNVALILDPLTKVAQKVAPFLMVLQNVTNLNINIYMNCREKLSEFPLNRFYRYVLEPELTFDTNGKLEPGPYGLFTDLPQTPLLTMAMDTPLGWMVEAMRSPHDLDNIYLEEVSKGVSADFELEYIFIEGHCADHLTGQPPRGLQFTLGTKAKPDIFDTIVMANLGYFQLKAFAGSWVLRVREGRSADIYDIDSVSGGIKQEGTNNYTIFIDSFVGKLMKVKVKRKPGMEGVDLLGDKDEEGGGGGGGLWDSLSSMVGSEKKKDKEEEEKIINIFSLASGHLYERFMRIMMLSVLKHTKSKVKFWFLKNYLSPTFKAFLPHMAKEYGFEYELVQYQWPRWLHAQTEKQRIIWGYKILFLDVLFPLHVKRILFVDADLIVRTDLQELMDLDLEGAPYAYTPFCDSRTEMEGFRFWKQGYWRSHLGYRSYHISALYAIDLKRFRRLAAGDRLRGQYQGLSQDPNSLSNLDQDLPNNMIHQVPIKSLPQDWLWCETWCSDESLKTAKTIDLCNNPQTKEPKLQSAVRIVKEWPEYDEEIRRLQKKLASAGESMENPPTEPTTPTVEATKTSKEEL